MADLLSVGVLFAAVAVAGAVAARIDKSVIPVYIVAGMVLSPSVADRVSLGGYRLPAVASTEFVEIGAELGIVFLLFFLGLEFYPQRLLESRTQILRAGTVDFLINFAVGLVIGVVLFGDLLAALLVAGVVYISSSAIITKSLIDLGWIANDEAEPLLGTLVFEDLVIAVYLTVAAALVAGGGQPREAVASVAVAVGFIAALVLVAVLGTAWFERSLATPSREYTVLRAVGITVLVAGAALTVNVSEAVAAFFVGMAFASTSHVPELEELLEPIRDTFAAVFFFWIGLEADPALIASVAGLVAVAALLSAPAKLLSGYLGGRAYGLDPRRSTRVGLGLVTRGEFSLIIAALALTGAGTSLPVGTAESLYAFAVGYVLVMSVLGTLLMQYSAPFERAVVARLG